MIISTLASVVISSVIATGDTVIQHPDATYVVTSKSAQRSLEDKSANASASQIALELSTGTYPATSVMPSLQYLQYQPRKASYKTRQKQKPIAEENSPIYIKVTK